MTSIIETPARPHDHGQCVADALAAAETLCAERGVRLTDIRRQVLALIWQGHNAVKAYDLLEMLSTETRAAKPPTVYRALDFLLEQGLIHRIESLNAFIGCTHPAGDHVSQFLICDRCHTVSEIEGTSVEAAVRRAAGKAGFAISRQTVEIHGMCAVCRG